MSSLTQLKITKRTYQSEGSVTLSQIVAREEACQVIIIMPRVDD